jgi:hypothetical protein
MNSQACLICNHITQSFIHPKSKITFHYCPNCEYIFKDQSAYPSLIEAKLNYEKHNNSILSKDYVDYLKRFVDGALIPFLCIKNASGLDFGSGPQVVLAEILKQDYGFNTAYYDPVFAPDLMFQQNQYDFIVSTEVFEHFVNPLQELIKLKELVVPGGVIAIMTLFHHSDREMFLKWWYIRDITHLGFFNIKTFQTLANLTNLELIYTDNNRYLTLRKKQG